MNTSSGSFYGLGVAPGILAKLETMGIKTPTPIQYKAIPIAIEGKDIIGIAQTGTGKTLAFGIPLLQRLAQKNGRGLILVPTRELALQVSEALSELTPATGIHTAVIIGGESIERQMQALKKNPRIIVATPGRLIDHMETRHLRLDDICVLVLDEADRMLDMGFAPQIEQILRRVPKNRQTMLFSATMPSKIMSIASAHMQLPVRTEIAPPGTAAASVSQELFIVRKELKGALLNKLLEQYQGTVLLFTRTKRGAKKVTQGLRKAGHRAAEIHSDRSLNQRKEALEGFKSGKYRILAATDIASRGIDVKEIELVINYDLPDDPENYVHRIGRTGRAGHEGHAISLATPEQRGDVRIIESLIKKNIPVSGHPDLPEEQFSASSAPSAPRQQQHHHHGGHGGGNGGRHQHSSHQRHHAGGGSGGGKPRRDRFEQIRDFIRKKNG